MKDVWRRQCGDKCTGRSSPPSDLLRELSVEELRQAEESVVWYVQLQSFGEENSAQ